MYIISKKVEYARTRTWNLLLRRQTRYPLRHAPILFLNSYRNYIIHLDIINLKIDMGNIRARIFKSKNRFQRKPLFIISLAYIIVFLLYIQYIINKVNYISGYNWHTIRHTKQTYLIIDSI